MRQTEHGNELANVQQNWVTHRRDKQGKKRQTRKRRNKKKKQQQQRIIFLDTMIAFV